MEVKNITSNITSGDIYHFNKLKNGYSVTLNLSGDTTNCKLSYIHGAAALLYLDDEDKKNVIDYLLTIAKGCVLLNTTQEKVADFVTNNYPIYYCNKVPVGYGTAFHYHVCFKNTVKQNISCREP